MAATKAGKVTDLELSRIIRDPEIQPREKMNPDTIVQYSEDMLAGIEFPPVVVYHDSVTDQYWLSQGFHRSEAAEAAGFSTILVEIRKGTRQDAMWDAAGSNREHDKSGLRRSNADKQLAVQIALKARPNHSDETIAKQVGVTPPTVAKGRSISKIFRDRDEVGRESTVNGSRVVTRKGTTYTMQTGNIGQRTASPVAEKEEEGDHGAEETEEEDDPDAGIEQETSNENEEEPPEEENEPEELFQLTPQSIASEVKPASRPTFNSTNEMVDWARWTWNPVTGCKHDCVYCLTPETLILYADMIWRPIGGVQVGDTLLGFDEYPEPGKTRKLRPSVVERVWWHSQPTFDIYTDEVKVSTTAEHLWLGSRPGRWMHTSSLKKGHTLRRIPIDDPPKDGTYHKVDHYLKESTPYKIGYLKAMTIGDGTFRYRPGQRNNGGDDPQPYWRVALADPEPLVRIAHYLTHDFEIEAQIRPFNSGGPSHYRPMQKVEIRSLEKLQAIHDLLSLDPDNLAQDYPGGQIDYARGFLAGFFDAEGHSGNTLHGTSLRMTQKDPTVLHMVKEFGRLLGFSFEIEDFDKAACKTVRLMGPLRDRIRFFSACRPAIARKMASVYGLGLDMEADRVDAIEKGPVRDVVDIQTSTRTFFANGLATHNCYARDIANRFYPEKFEPTFRPERLEAPRNTGRPHVATNETDSVLAMSWRNVFVCSMADLFGRWVPDQWIEDVFASCRKSPEWNYLFLTKFPQRYVGLDFPETAWVGTSVDEQKRVANAEKAFAKIEVPVRWLSVEPMREKIVFRDLSMFDWVVIGGQSRSSEAPEFHPEPWWVIDLAWKAREAGCKVYLKPNTFRDMGWQIKEYPY